MLSYLKIGFFNINGLVGQTTYNTDFSEIIKKYDIITLTETWHKSAECIKKIKGNFPKDYIFIDNVRKIRKVKEILVDFLYVIKNVSTIILLSLIKHQKT